MKNDSDLVFCILVVSISQASRSVLLLSSQGATLLSLLQLAKVMLRLTKGWLLLTDWRCLGLFLELHDEHTLLPLWTNEVYLSGCVFQRQSAWSEEVNVRKHFISWNRLTCSAVFPQAVSVLLCSSAYVCVCVSVPALVIRSSRVREGRIGYSVLQAFTNSNTKICKFITEALKSKTSNVCYKYICLRQNVLSTSGSFVPLPFNSVTFTSSSSSYCHYVSSLSVSFISLCLAAVCLSLSVVPSSLYPSSLFFLSGRMV